MSCILTAVGSVQIAAVWAVGLAEGLTHVNWRKVLIIVAWWVGSLVPVFVAAAALLAQGRKTMQLSLCLPVFWLQNADADLHFA